jgi:hypothetical protein
MKKLILGLFVAVFVSAGVATAGVQAADPQTDVTGVITENHVAVAGANVTALCNGHTQTDTTDAWGSYLVIFTTTECPFGSTVKITAEKDGKSGVTTGTVQGITTKLNLAIVNVSIPEYGLIGTALAGGAGLGLMAYMRRRQQQMQS